MSRGMTIADFVQQVLYMMYRVRLDVSASSDNNDDNTSGNYHSHSDKFKEIVMEANLMLQEFQKEQDWSFLRERWNIGPAKRCHGFPQEIKIPDNVYHICSGFSDSVRLHLPRRHTEQIQFAMPSTGNASQYDMHDSQGFANVDRNQQRAFIVKDTLTFYRPWYVSEVGGLLETDVIKYIEPLHICDSNCVANCPKAYNELQFRWMPDPYYFVVRTAARRAVADPSCAEVMQSLIDEATKMLSAIRSNDQSHNYLDTYETSTIGYIGVL